jgi:xanthosine utilization system XapX-like protein
MLRLRMLLVQEVTGKWNRVTMGGVVAGTMGFYTFFVAEAIVGVACPPLAILGAWGLAFGSGITGFISQVIDDAKLSEWWKRTIALEERFPQLQMIRL